MEQKLEQVLDLPSFKQMKFYVALLGSKKFSDEEREGMWLEFASGSFTKREMRGMIESLLHRA